VLVHHSFSVLVDESRCGLTVEKIIITPFKHHIRYLDKFELHRSIFVFVVKVLLQPLRSLKTPHRTTNIIPTNKQLIDDITSNQPIDARHEDCCVRLNHHGRHFGSVCVKRSGGGVDDEVSKKGLATKCRKRVQKIGDGCRKIRRRDLEMERYFGEGESV
jgi:hypothetical protein